MALIIFSLSQLLEKFFSVYSFTTVKLRFSDCKDGPKTLHFHFFILYFGKDHSDGSPVFFNADGFSLYGIH